MKYIIYYVIINLNNFNHQVIHIKNQMFKELLIIPYIHLNQKYLFNDLQLILHNVSIILSFNPFPINAFPL